MNKYVLKSSELCVHLVRRKKFQKKEKKLPSHGMTPLIHMAMSINIRCMLQSLYTNASFIFFFFCGVYNKRNAV